jgi:peptide/nickel transport system permease protein
VTRARLTGAVLLTLIVTAAAAAPALSPYAPLRQFTGFENAPPMLPHVLDAQGSFHWPFVYPLRLVNRLERQYAEDTDRPIPIRWFSDGVIASVDPTQGAWFPLGTDPLGRDVFARLLNGTRLSLGVACVALIGALAVGLVVGGAAGFFGGRVDTWLMAMADFVLVLPAIYVVLAFRAALPLVLSVPQVFWALALVLTVAGWPVAARGVRAIVAGERRKEYAEAAYAAGAGPLRILLRHLLPATGGFLAYMATMLLPAFVLTEATMSLVGLGFPVPSATWGTMMRDAWQGAAFADAPWLLAPALMIVLCVLSLHLLTAEEAGDVPRAGTFS